MTRIKICHDIGNTDGECDISFANLKYKRWFIFIETDPSTDFSKIKKVKYVLPQCYPHRIVPLRSGTDKFQYTTCGYQSNYVDCIMDLDGTPDYKRVTHFVNINKPGKTTIEWP